MPSLWRMALVRATMRRVPVPTLLELLQQQPLVRATMRRAPVATLVKETTVEMQYPD